MLTGLCRLRVGCRARIDIETDPVSSDSDWRDARERRAADPRPPAPPRRPPPSRWRRDRRFRRLLTAVILFNVLAFGVLAWALLRDSGTTSPPRTVADHPPTVTALPLQTTNTGTLAAAPNPKPKPKPKPRLPAASAGSQAAGLNVGAAVQAAGAEQAAGHHVGFALVTANGQTVGELGASHPNYGASITKAMLLVGYLAEHPDTIDASARSELTAMIENSDNSAADWVYAHLHAPADELSQVAQAAGMTGFQLNTSDPVYVLGQSQITAGDFARLFARIDQLLPAGQRNFALSLLANVSPHSGLLAAGLPGVVYAKEGWKPESSGMLGAPYIVNQAAQFHLHGVTYGVAVTVGGVSDETEGEAVVQRVVAALRH